MSRTCGFLALIGLVLAALGAWMIHAHRGDIQDRVLVTPSCRVPLTVLSPAGGAEGGSAVIFHGIAASRRLMLTLGRQFAANGFLVYLVDSPGHGDSTDSFSLSRVEACAAEALDTLVQRNELHLDRTILVGHSMGGAIAMRLADYFPAAATVAVSPAPMVQVGWLPSNSILFAPPRRMPNNLLIFTGALEPSLIHQADEALLRNAGGERASATDFIQKRAAQLVRISGDAHTSLVFDPRVARRSIVWSRLALGLPPVAVRADFSPAVGSALGLIGILLASPLFLDSLAILFKVSAPSPGALSLHPAVWPTFTVAIWTIVSLTVVTVLQLAVPLRFLHILTGDYYASFKLVAGLLLLLAILVRSRRTLSQRATPSGHDNSLVLAPVPVLFLSSVYGLALVLTVGAWLNWQTTDLWMNMARWWRFLLLVPIGMPFYLAEEQVLGAPSPKSRFRRWTLFGALRLVVWGAMVVAMLVFRNDQILILLLGPFLAVLAVAQRGGADSVRRRTGSPAAAALFSAILGAWFIAAVLPLT